MDRDPTNYECTRDPIFLLQSGSRNWLEFPVGTTGTGDGIIVTDQDWLDDWIRPFIDDGYVDESDEFYKLAEKREGTNGLPLVMINWRVEDVFLTRSEAEEYGRSRSHRWSMWKVYCVPASGQLAKLLREYEPEKEITAGDGYRLLENDEPLRAGDEYMGFVREWSPLKSPTAPKCQRFHYRRKTSGNS